MTSFQSRQIIKRLKADFVDHIDLSDVAHHGDEQLDRFAITRALAALVACSVGGLSAEDAARCVTDESGDLGIDAVTTDPLGKTFYLIQAKTSPGAPNPTEISKFHDGIRTFIDGEWNNFGPKISDRSEEFDQLLEEGVDQFVAIYAYLGDQPVDPDGDVSRLTDRFLQTVNLNGEILTAPFWNTREIYEKRNAAQAPQSLEHDIYFSKWTAPFASHKSEVVGVVPATEIYDMAHACGDRLFDKNIRKALGGTPVNEDMAATLREAPERFWHYNNGVTIVASQIDAGTVSPKPAHTFTLRGLSVVNGAQTCSTIHNVGIENKDSLANAFVTVKVVSLENQSEDFEHLVTRFTNTQNKIGGREFAALDPRQQEIHDGLRPEGIYYSFRTGDTADAEFSEQFSITEATQALAVKHSVSHATRVRSKVGSFWADINAAPYTDIFNEQTDPAVVWNSVKLWRRIRDYNGELSAEPETSRGSKIVTHSVHLFGSLVFRRAYRTKLDFADFDVNLDNWFDRHKDELRDINSAIVEEHEQVNPAGYPANFFKNQTKVEELASAVEKRLGEPN